MKKAVKWTLITLLVLGTAAYGVYEWLKPLSLDLVTLAPADVSVTFRETGTVEPPQKWEVFPPLSLTLKTVHVSDGDLVQAGQVLATLDVTPLEQQLKILEAQISVVSASLGSTRRNYSDSIAVQELGLSELRRQHGVAEKEKARTQDLFGEGLISQAELDAADNSVKTLLGAIRQMEHEISLLRTQAVSPDSHTTLSHQTQEAVLRAQQNMVLTDIGKAPVIAPVSGIVTLLAAKEGQPVGPHQPLCQLLMTGTPKLEVLVLTEDIAELSLGMPVALIQKLREGDLQYTGTVQHIAPSAVERISSLGLVEKRVRVDVVSDQLEGMIYGSRLDVLFTTHEEKNVLAVPKMSLFKLDGQDHVWLVREGKLTQQAVEPGLETDLLRVIKNGLSSGDSIVRNPNVEGLAEGKAAIPAR